MAATEPYGSYWCLSIPANRHQFQLFKLSLPNLNWLLILNHGLFTFSKCCHPPLSNVYLPQPLPPSPSPTPLHRFHIRTTRELNPCIFPEYFLADWNIFRLPWSQNFNIYLDFSCLMRVFQLNMCWLSFKQTEIVWEYDSAKVASIAPEKSGSLPIVLYFSWASIPDSRGVKLVQIALKFEHLTGPKHFAMSDKVVSSALISSFCQS